MGREETKEIHDEHPHRHLVQEELVRSARRIRE